MHLETDRFLFLHVLSLTFTFEFKSCDIFNLMLKYLVYSQQIINAALMDDFDAVTFDDKDINNVKRHLKGRLNHRTRVVKYTYTTS